MAETRDAQNTSGRELICELSSLSATERLRYQDLRKQLQTAQISSTAILNGYALQFNEERISMEQITEWIRLEGLCCPWLTLRVDRIKPGAVEVRINVPHSANEILRMELGELLAP